MPISESLPLPFSPIDQGKDRTKHPNNPAPAWLRRLTQSETEACYDATPRPRKARPIESAPSRWRYLAIALSYRRAFCPRVRFVTPDEFKRSVLYEAERKSLFNNAIHDAEAALREKAEELFGGIGASLNAAYEVEFVSIHNRWRQDIEDARVEDLVGTHVPGDRCFTVAPEIWQSAILSRSRRPRSIG